MLLEAEIHFLRNLEILGAPFESLKTIKRSLLWHPVADHHLYLIKHFKIRFRYSMHDCFISKLLWLYVNPFFKD